MEFQPPRVRVGKWPTGKSGLTIYSCASCALNNPKGSHSHVTVIGFTVIDLQLWQISDKWQNSILRKWSNFLTCTKSPISARSGTASKTQEGVRREGEKEGKARGTCEARTLDHQRVNWAFLFMVWFTTDSTLPGGDSFLYLWVFLPI